LRERVEALRINSRLLVAQTTKGERVIVGISITKEEQFRGRNEEFSNVYHFDAAVGMQPANLANAVSQLERPVFNSTVQFKSWKAWGPTNQGKAANEMLDEGEFQNLSGGAGLQQIYSELAAVVSWSTGRKNTRGQMIYLRKYLHVCGAEGTSAAPGLTDATIPTTQQTALITYGNAVKNVNVGASQQVAHLVDKMGRRLPVGTDPKVLPHFHIRQFRG
jgi:hypothetical protein